MRTKIAIGLLCVAAVLASTGMVRAQTATLGPKVQLPSGETVWDLTGDWDALVEIYGPVARDGTCPNAYRITQTGSTFSAVRLKDDPLLTKESIESGHSSWGRAGSRSVQGELEQNGFKRVQIVLGSGGRIVPSLATSVTMARRSSSTTGYTSG